MSELPFQDRLAAGRALAERLQTALAPLAAGATGIVLALPRGGVPVGWEVAQALGAELDVLVVRKLGFPGQEEYAMGALASGGVRVASDGTDQWPIDAGTLERVTARELAQLQRREALYRGQRPMPALTGRRVLLVDDGLATGATMRAAVRAARRQSPAELIVAVPVAASDSLQALRAEADQIVVVYTPKPFRAVGLWYRDFEQTSDEEVQRLLAKASQARARFQREHRL